MSNSAFAEMAAFANDLAHLKHDLEQRAVGSWGDCQYEDPLANGFLALLAALENGSEPLDAVRSAISVWRHAHEQHSAAYEQIRIKDDGARAEAARNEEISRKAECPRCGAAPGRACSTAPGGYMRAWSHRDRWRHARSLNDGNRELR